MSGLNLTTSSPTTANPLSLFVTLQTLLQSIPPCMDSRGSENIQIASRDTFNQSKFDFIVIGSGPGGSVVASRLTENPAIKVLLLEAGGAESCMTDVPAMDAVNSVLQSKKFMRYMTEKQKNGGLGFPNQQILLPTGRNMGGGSAINGMVYNRGGANDFDGWKRDYNCTGWGYSDVLPFFKKSENNIDPLMRADTKYHGTSGPLTISSIDINQSTEQYRLVSNTLLNAYSQMEYQKTDFNGPKPLGTSTVQRIVRNGKRQSTSKAFLEPVFKNRPNLQILTGAVVTKIITLNKMATGVVFTWKGDVHTANVTKEVIVSAGAIETPKLLMLSGIGPAAHLKSLNITVVADLPVGQNFQDHVRVGGLNYNVNQSTSNYWTEFVNPANWLQYSLYGTGPLSNEMSFHQPPFLNIRTTVPDRGFLYGPSDLFIAPAIFPMPLVGLSVIQHQIDWNVLTKYYLPNFLEPQLNLFIALNYVKSRGYVKLRSNNPNDPPIVDPMYFTDPYGDDMARVVQAFQLGLKLLEKPAFQAIGAKLFRTTLPGCVRNDSVPYSDDIKYIKCVISMLSSTECHPCCSARMAGETDPSAVVGPRLKVIGVKGLRVVDASVMPFVVTANPMAATIMIGEKGAFMILQDNGYPVVAPQ